MYIYNYIFIIFYIGLYFYFIKNIYGATGDNTPNVLHGKWDNKSKEVQIKEIVPENGIREFSGCLTTGESGENEKITIIRGTWKWGERKGQFVCCKESDKSSSMLYNLI